MSNLLARTSILRLATRHHTGSRALAVSGANNIPIIQSRSLSSQLERPGGAAPTRTRLPAPSKDEELQTFNINSAPRPKRSSANPAAVKDDNENVIRKPITPEEMVLIRIDMKNKKRLKPDAKPIVKEVPAESITQRYRVNDEISDVSEALLIGPSGSLGKLSIDKIREEASKQKLDMVEVTTSPNVVIRLMDFKAFVEEKKKQRKEREVLMGTQPKTLEEPLGPLKEIQVGTNIEHHDFELKKEMMRKFLEKNHPVKLTLKFKRSSFLKSEGRPQRAQELIERVLSDLSEVIAAEKTKADPKPAPGSVVKFFYPKQQKLASKQEKAASSPPAPK